MRSFRPWLVQILQNTCSDMLRKRIKQRSQPTACTAEAPESFADPLPLREALARLSPEHRTAIVLHYLEGYSVKEIAGLLGIPSGTVKSRLLYARKNLRDMLRDSIDD